MSLSLGFLFSPSGVIPFSQDCGVQLVRTFVEDSCQVNISSSFPSLTLAASPPGQHSEVPLRASVEAGTTLPPVFFLPTLVWLTCPYSHCSRNFIGFTDEFLIARQDRFFSVFLLFDLLTAFCSLFPSLLLLLQQNICLFSSLRLFSPFGSFPLHSLPRLDTKLWHGLFSVPFLRLTLSSPQPPSLSCLDYSQIQIASSGPSSELQTWASTAFWTDSPYDCSVDSQTLPTSHSLAFLNIISFVV